MFRGLCQAVKEFHSQNPPYAHRYDQKKSLKSLTFSSLKNMIITVYLFFLPVHVVFEQESTSLKTG